MNWKQHHMEIRSLKKLLCAKVEDAFTDAIVALPLSSTGRTTVQMLDTLEKKIEQIIKETPQQGAQKPPTTAGKPC